MMIVATMLKVFCIRIFISVLLANMATTSYTSVVASAQDTAYRSLRLTKVKAPMMRSRIPE